jgi:hypothetical protein
MTEARETLRFAVEHSQYIDFLNTALFNLPVNSPEAPKLGTTGFYEGDLSLYTDFMHPMGWDRKIVRHFLDREFKRHPVIQTIVRRHPTCFGSNHAPLIAMEQNGALEPRNNVK